MQDSDDPNEVERANAIIEKNAIEYEKHYQNIKNNFSKEFLSVYESGYRFHDWNIESIAYYTSKNRKNDRVKLKLSYCDACCTLTFKHVSIFRMDSFDENCDSYYIGDKDIYYADEWNFLSNGLIKYEMLSLCFSKIEIICKSISLKQKKLIV